MVALQVAAMGLAAGQHGLRAQTPGADSGIVGEFAPAGEGLPLYRSSGSVAVLAVATPDWLPVPVQSRELLGNYRFIPDAVTLQARGQVFRLLEAEGGWDVTEGTGRFVGAPWTLGCGCSEVGWQEPEWVPPGDTVAFILSKTRATTAEGVPPVYDLLGWHQPYPVGDFILYWRRVRQAPPDWLSPKEFFRLLQTLPTDRQLRLDPQGAVQGLRKWLAENPGRAGAFPLPSMMETLGLFAAPAQGGRPPGS